MKDSYNRIFALLILFVSVLLFSMLAVTAAVVSAPQTIHMDESVEIEAKYKKTSTTNRITFNANGGKIGSKKTQVANVKRGSAINKFPTTPKRTGYTFKGWYTKKSGGKKIAVSTKPTKSITLYAQWKKKSSSNIKALSASEKKLVGLWSAVSSSGGVYDIVSGAYRYPEGTGLTYSFKADRTFYQVNTINTGISRFMQTTEGSWRESGGTIYLTYKRYQISRDGGSTFTPWAPHGDSNHMKIRYGSDERGKYFVSSPDYGVEFYYIR